MAVAVVAKETSDPIDVYGKIDLSENSPGEFMVSLWVILKKIDSYFVNRDIIIVQIWWLTIDD